MRKQFLCGFADSACKATGKANVVTLTRHKLGEKCTFVA